MGKKENRPDACTASGTASTICDYDSTFVSAGQDMTENELIRKVTEDYLAGIDVDICPAPEQVERELLQATNNAIEAYNLGPRDPNAPVGAKQQDAYPDQKKGDARLRLRKHLDPYQIALVVRELHHAVGILWKDAGDDGNFDIGVYQTSGDNEGTYDVSEDGLTRLIRSYDSAITIRGVYETIAVLRSVCPHVERCHDRDLIAVNNGVYDYGNKMLLGFDPEFVFTGKVRVDFVENAPNPVIHNDEDGTDWDVVSWMDELSDDKGVVKLLWQIVGAVIRPGVSWNKSAWFYSTSGNNGKGTLCSLMRNLLGRGSWESISLKDFSSLFMLEPLMRISAVITDENDTGTFVDDAAALKSIITGDPFQLNRKFKEPRTVLFKGFMVQCVNELPRLRDRSESMAATLQEALAHCIGGENAAINPLVIENRLHDLDKDLDRLLTMEGSEIVDLRIKQISDEMLQLRQMKKRAELDTQQDMGRENKAKEIMELISTEDLDLTEYSDTLVYRVIERVTVLSKEEIRIRFIGGFELTQPLH